MVILVSGGVSIELDLLGNRIAGDHQQTRTDRIGDQQIFAKQQTQQSLGRCGFWLVGRRKLAVMESRQANPLQEGEQSGSTHGNRRDNRPIIEMLNNYTDKYSPDSLEESY